MYAPALLYNCRHLTSLLSLQERSPHATTASRQNVFTALHGMQTRSSDENSVCLSVCLSVRLSNACIVIKRKKDLSRFLYHTKDHLAQFSEKKNGWWGATHSTLNFVSTGLRWSKIDDFEPIFACRASAVTPSKKVQSTLIGSYALSNKP